MDQTFRQFILTSSVARKIKPFNKKLVFNFIYFPTIPVINLKSISILIVSSDLHPGWQENAWTPLSSDEKNFE